MCLVVVGGGVCWLLVVVVCVMTPCVRYGDAHSEVEDKKQLQQPKALSYFFPLSYELRLPIGDVWRVACDV